MNIDPDTQRRWFNSHVRQLVNTVMENQVEPDADGDFIFHGETSYGWICPVPYDPWGVQFLVVTAIDVPDRVGVLRELNEVNALDPLVTVFRRADGVVAVTYRMPAEALTEMNIRGMLTHVITVADRIGPMIAAVHGGSTPKQPYRPAITEG